MSESFLAPLTNVLAIPFVTMAIEVANNEDWLDSLVYLVGSINGPQLDLRGIYFGMEIRHNTPDHEVVFHGSTDDGVLSIGQPPDYGYLIFNVPVTKMEFSSPGLYVGDVVATDQQFTRRVIDFQLTLVQGVTRGEVG
jgi:hypothetical protein